MTIRITEYLPIKNRTDYFKKVNQNTIDFVKLFNGKELTLDEIILLYKPEK